jgi:hypothetical protein
MILRSTNVDIEDCEIIRCCGNTSGVEGDQGCAVYISDSSGTVNVVRTRFDNDGKGKLCGGALFLNNNAAALNLLGSEFVNWEFGEVGLEKIVRSFINDFMPDSVWAEKK